MENWDAIVIGAGISGMCAASLLAGAGKRVLVLEKQDQIGGRATTLNVKIAGEEYRMDNGSFHAITMADRGALGVTYERGPGLDKLKLGDLQAGMALFREDGWWEMKDLVKGENRDDFKRIVESIASMSYEQAELLDTVSFDSWIRQATRRQNVYDFFRGVIWTLTTIPYPEEVSAGEVLVTIKMSLDSLHRISSGTFGLGGSINLVKPLAEFIISREGEMRTGMRASRILIRKGEVRGVAVDRPLLGVGKGKSNPVVSVFQGRLSHEKVDPHCASGKWEGRFVTPNGIDQPRGEFGRGGKFKQVPYGDTEDDQ